MQRNTSFPLLLLCFFLSGLAGLIYQTAWTREFAFVFGTSNLAIATVLSAYMAGLAAGAGLAARFADRIRRPLLSYGVLELGVGLTALCVPFAIHASQVLYVAILGGRSDLPESGGLATAIFYLICSSLILMVPTAMMGATLPLLVRHSVYNEQQIGSRIGLLYAINTAGAVVGTLLAAFWLLPTLGLRQTIWAAAGVNGLVFLAAWAMARSSEGQNSRSSRAAEPQGAHGLSGSRWVLPLIFGSGFVSFSYEVLWTRLLDHLLGGSVYAFASMLASFLLGISIGAALASRYCRTREQAVNGFVVAQVAIALLSAVAFELIDQVPNLVNSLTAAGVSPRLVEAMASLLVLLPPATAIGATFPFAVRILARGQDEAGAASAKVYAGNTSGSVLGAVAAGFFIVPALGFSGTLGACVAANLGLAAAAASLFQLRFRYRRGLQIACAIVAVTFLVAPPELPWRVLRYSPIRHVSSMQEDVEYFE
ncbi:MAG: fused MFS/spermidine synthase, partial [Deltaproteobacteria bacterium]|nr:fused MFS/spermidine synthase [Deltaproteobacteria bacterium]